MVDGVGLNSSVRLKNLIHPAKANLFRFWNRQPVVNGSPIHHWENGRCERVRRIRFWRLAGLLVGGALLNPYTPLGAQQQVPARHLQGTVHGFLILRSATGKALANGELTQVIRGGQVVSHVVFHFHDGSIDDETTIFSQRDKFLLLSDRHLQKGPVFSNPMDVSINAITGQVTVHSLGGGKDKVETYHLHLPPDLANGLLLTILTNIRPNAPETRLSYLAVTPKPRMVTLVISPEGGDTFSVGGAHHKATRYVVKTELGGVAGVVAPLIGKQPKDERVWVVGGIAPAFVKMEGPLAYGGPVWQIELTSPVWQ